jgi:hypothetical protein
MHKTQSPQKPNIQKKLPKSPYYKIHPRRNPHPKYMKTPPKPKTRNTSKPKKRRRVKPKNNNPQKIPSKNQKLEERPTNQPKHTTLQHKVFSFPTPSRRLSVAIVDRAMQFRSSLLPLDFWRDIILSRWNSFSMASRIANASSPKAPSDAQSKRNTSQKLTSSSQTTISPLWSKSIGQFRDWEKPLPSIGEELEQPLGGEECPTIPPSTTFCGEEEVVVKTRRGLRNPFLRKSFTGGSTTFFTGGSTTETLLTAKSATIFKAFRESESRTLFHFHETRSLSTLAFLKYLWKGLETTGGEERSFSPNSVTPAEGEAVSWETAGEAPKGLEAVTRLGSTFKLLDPPPEEETRTGKAPETAGDEVFGRTDGAGKAKDALGTAIPFPDETASKPLGGERTRENPEENEPTGRALGTADDESSGRDGAGKGGVPGSIAEWALGFGRSRAKRKP